MTFTDLEFDFHISRKTIPFIVKETCKAIWEVLSPKEMPLPNKEIWLKIADQFHQVTDFPNCLGAVDGKHIRIICPPSSGSQYFNYKKYFSIVLLGVADANYCFTAIDVGAYGREGDSIIFKNSNFGRRLFQQQLDLPSDRPLHLTTEPSLPFVFVGDEAFGLNEHLMRPYPSRNTNEEHRIFNCRLSRARRLVECTFGILSNKWRILHSSMLVLPETAIDIVKSCCVLHNFVRRRDGYVFEDSLTCDMDDVEQVAAVGGRSTGIAVRDSFSAYFSGTGALPWLNKRVQV
jgi:hypothetical protein